MAYISHAGAAQRIVFDTAALITALRSRSGAAREILRLVLQQQVTIVMDLKLALEYRAVALRPAQLGTMRASSGDVLATLMELEANAEAVEVVSRLRPFPAIRMTI